MTNRLAHESSPYLQQHAHNPVDWLPWGEEAFRLARERDLPILLSVGYSTCHWCHVMAAESFEDEDTARLMNEHYVSVKVDREERPDLDQIYQTAHAMLTRRSGGWPLTLFLTPDGLPFYGGTYFPREGRFGLPAFKEVLEGVARYYHQNRGEIGAQNQRLQDAFAHTLPRSGEGVVLGRGPLDLALRELAGSFDPVHGGFGGAPKFPHPGELALLLHHHAARGDETALAMVDHTLARMAEGGIFDQLGGGFCRYAVDERWEIPHFEKMLYDNGQLLALLADAWAATHDPRLKQAAQDTAAWLLREMRAPGGGFYSALDADSEHHEGRFYVWTPEAVQALLNAGEYAVAAPHWGLDQPPNFENQAWHLKVARPLSDVAREQGQEQENAMDLLASAREKLFAARASRVRPGRDEKVLTAWNALAIRGLARAARVFGREDWLDAAFAAADFLRRELWQGGRLLASWKGGRASLFAYLDDHAFLLNALLELMQGRFRIEDLDWARELAQALLARFEDREAGGFFFTSHDHEALIHRPKTGHDNATPSGNGVAAFALQRLGHLLGETRYLRSAERTLKLFYPAIEDNPAGFATLLLALDEALAPPAMVILRGPGEALTAWQQRLAGQPARLVLALPNALSGLSGILARPESATPRAWVCKGTACLAPLDSLESLVNCLK